MNEILNKLDGLCGIEIGGPSSLFSTDFPVYNYLSEINIVNFKKDNIWANSNLNNDKFIELDFDEGTTLSKINKKYDVLLSSHVIEHIANPIKAFKRWIEITDKYLIMIVPDKKFTFDSTRKLTTMDHLLKDYFDDVDENDSTHFDDFNNNTFWPNGSKLYIDKNLLINNGLHRSVHHHIFDEKSILDFYKYFSNEVDIIYHGILEPWSLLTVLKKIK